MHDIEWLSIYEKETSMKKFVIGNSFYQEVV
jgi:hypothetical protein